MAYQSLYRRYRSQRFSELRGQSHVTSALQAAVANGRVGHAYLFSGPRGTGKTSTARILAKALNCENVADGEPCCECDSCLAIENGRSFDVHELDAASNNKVDDIRDLISKVHLGSPGRTKVYILDEVHMLSAGAENALLKTLEEPPDHVVFVLATTEPHKVVSTIRSRTQPFEFHLLPADELGDHVRYVIEDAGLDVDDDAIDYVLRQGGGSARDTLSALDLVAAAGGVPAGSDVGVVVADAIGANDAQSAIAAVQEGLTNGQEPRTIGEATLEVLRGAFLAAMGAPLDHLHDTAQETAQRLAAALGPATLTRSLEAIGSTLVDMRQAPDPRVPLEVTLLQLTRSPGSAPTTESSAAPAPTAGVDGDLVAKLLARIDGLENQVNDLRASLDSQPTHSTSQPTNAAPSQSSPPRAESSPAQPAESKPTGPAAAARNRLDEVTAKAPRSPRSKRAEGTLKAVPDPDPEPAPASEPPPAVAAVAATAEPANEGQTEPDVPPEPTEPATTNEPAPTTSANTEASTETRPLSAGEATQAMETQLDEISQRARVRFKVGQVKSTEGSTIVFGVPNNHYVDRCNEAKEEVEAALSKYFGQPLNLQIVVDDAAPPESLDPAKIGSTRSATVDDSIDDIGPVDELADATDQSADGVERLTKAFPGSKIVEPKPE